MIQYVARFGMNWVAQVDAPWFVAGVLGAGVPTGLAAGSVITDDGKAFSLVTAVGGALGGVAADHLSSSLSSYMMGCSFTCYDVLTRGVGPACLLLVILIPNVRRNGHTGGGSSSYGAVKSGLPSLSAAVSVKPAAFAALASLVLEPLFTAFVLGNATVVGGRNAASGGTLAIVRRFAQWPLELLTGGLSNTLGRRRNKAAAVAAANAAASAVSRARWLTGGAQLALWIATMLSLGRIALCSARASRGARRTVGTYMAALGELASRKRGTGAWARVERQGGEAFGGSGGAEPNSPVPGGRVNSGWKDERCRPRSHSILGSLYERLAGGWKGGAGSCLFKANCPPYERGEVTVRGLYCSGLDVALTGKTSTKHAAAASGAGSGADRGGGIAGGDARPFYVTITLENVTARTSVRTGFCPTFTEVFPLGIDCPIRGAILVLRVVDSFETGRSGRGDRVVGEAQVPVDAADLVSGSLADPSGGGPTYRLKGEWELRGVVGVRGLGARIGAEIVVRGPPDPNSAAGRLRRRESVGWYAR